MTDWGLRRKVQERRYGVMLSKKGARHLVFLLSIADEVKKIDDAKGQYERAMSLLAEHKKGGRCMGCTTAFIEEARRSIKR